MIRDVNFIERSSPLLKEIISCFTAFHIDRQKYEAIKTPVPLSNSLSDEISNARNLIYDAAGFTFTEILGYINSIEKKEASPSDIQRLFELLINKNIISIGNRLVSDLYTNANPVVNLPTGDRYKITGEGLVLYIMGLTENLVFGPSYIINRYKSAIIQVLGVTADGDHTIGTGFLIKLNEKCKIVTCKHNILGLHDLKFISGNGPLTYTKINHAENIDCVLIDIEENDLQIDVFKPSPSINILSEIITMGYPTIPRSGDAYLMVHKGEINGIVKDYYKENEFIIFSAKTSSGNSGSPLIDEDGGVLGIVTDEFFDRDAYIEKGKPPYYAAIPFEAINNAFNLNLWKEIIETKTAKLFIEQFR